MEFLSAHCFTFLFVAIIAGLFAIINQVIRIVGMGKAMKNFDMDAAHGSFFNGIGIFALAGFTCAVSSLLFIVGIIIRLTT